MFVYGVHDSCSSVLQVEGKLATVTVQQDRLVAESEEKIKAATNAVDDLKQEKQQLLVQLEERQRCNMILLLFVLFVAPNSL